MSKKGRYSPEQRQEDISLDQARECLNSHGWPAERIARDLGEDLLVRIYDQGRSSGLLFATQVKSTSSLSRLKVRGKGISYRLDVADLEHWEDAVPPVFVLVWDVEKRTGCWVGVAEAIVELDKKGRTWRSRKTARVRVPLANSTSKEGLGKLRRKVADYAYPVVSKNKTFDVRAAFAFPKTPEGTAAQAALEDHLKSGKPVQIDGQFIDRFEFPAWWTRLYGERPATFASLSISPVRSGTPILARIEVRPDEGEGASFDYVELRTVRAGTEEVELANDEQKTDVHFRFVFRTLSESVTISVQVTPVPDVHVARRQVALLCPLSRSGKFRLTFLREGKTLEFVLPHGVFAAPPADFVGLLDNLCLIQERTGQTLVLPPKWQVKRQDIRDASEVAEIIRTGRAVLRDRCLSVELPGAEALRMLSSTGPGGQLHLRVRWTEVQAKCLGTAIPLGPTSLTTAATPKVAVEDLKEAAAKLGPQGTLTVEFIAPEVLYECQNWLPESKGGSLARAHRP